MISKVSAPFGTDDLIVYSNTSSRLVKSACCFALTCFSISGGGVTTTGGVGGVSFSPPLVGVSYTILEVFGISSTEVPFLILAGMTNSTISPPVKVERLVALAVAVTVFVAASWVTSKY